jgi:AcrR family transcriptional regulator
VNQKRRTRAAIVDAARELLAAGATPTVAQAAEQAMVSRTTAYRYFPTQESLLLEIAVTADVDDLEALVAEPVDAGGAADRVRLVLDRFNERVLADEAQYRTAARLYHDLWLAAAASGEQAPVVREGRRRRWLAASLAPLAGTVEPERLDRAVDALCLLMGIEAMSVLHDVARLDDDQARAVASWVADLVLATLQD